MSILDRSRALKALVPEPGNQRVFGLAAFINTIGIGLVMPSVVLYFTQVVHLSAVQVGLGFTISGLVALLASLPGGDLADRIGPLGVVRVTLVLQGVASFAYLFIDGFLAFVLIATAEMLVTNANMAATGALIRRVGGENAMTFRSTLRALTHFGITIGVLAAGIGIQIGTANAYRSLLFINGVTFLIAFVILLRLPHYPPLPKPPDGPRWTALADRPFVAYAATAGAMSVFYFVLELPLPLWIVAHTNAPHWSVPIFLLINTVMVIFLQVRVGKNVQTIAQGGAAMRRAGVIFLVSSTAIGLAAGLPGWLALLLLIAAVALHSYGELWFSSGSFAFDFGMAPQHSQGQYQGLSGLGSGLGSAAAPVVLIGLVISAGRFGWIGLGVVLALLGLLAPVVARWGERTRPEEPVAETAPAAGADLAEVVD